ncbi:m7GpppX diphosphatase isoform X2 [Aedes albopictus]|uniref:m7GpppX diphosphatase n=1 Tax=Aedes albopictus TaxID=7160 RepID=A0ABM1YN58_AEDAL|nr:m7GpppX diphosphatase-like isoform X3 [Aedes albopictus]
MLEAAKQQKSDSVNSNNSINSSNHDDEHQQRRQVLGGSTTSTSYDLAQFEPVRILNNNSTHKSVSLLGHFGNLSRDKFAIIVLEKTAFTEAQLRNYSVVTKAAVTQTATTSSESESENSSTTAEVVVAAERSVFSSKSHLRTEFINDIYGNFLCVTDPEVNQLKVTIIYPATEKHISKYSAHARFLLEETADDYRSVTLPHLEQEQLSLEWLYNILEHRKEKDRIVYEDPSDEVGFILLPDLKWDGKTLEQLYLLALVRPKGIKSLRDLTTAHLPLLRNIREGGIKAIKERYGISSDHLRIYVHYQPSFYHLHVHFTYLKHDPPGIHCEKSHLLTTIIENLELVPDYYQRVTLSCVLSETDKLYAKLKAAKENADEDQPKVKRTKIE